jgi:hypothetical protein
MLKLKVVAALVAVCVGASGCAPVLVGALMYDHIASRDDKRKFTETFNKENLEREKAGLPRLDWCSEVYKFSKSWANEQPGCAERIKRFEAGDATALQV